MKKSILLTTIAMLFVVVVAWGQTSNCDETQNKKKVGVEHSYEVTIDDTNSPKLYDGDGLYTWYVTSNTADLLKKDVAYATGTDGVFNVTNDYFTIKEHTADATSSDYNEDDIANKDNTTKKLTLTWNPEALTIKDKFYLVLNYTENNSTCNANNVKVLKIEPINTFKLLVQAAKEDGSTFASDDDEKTCSAKVSGAKLVGNKIQYVYGETTLYYLITPSGFTGKWKPQITLPKLAGKTSVAGLNRKYKSVEWKALEGSTTYTSFTNTQTNTNGSEEFLADKVATIEDNATGNKNKILVKVVIENGTYEGLSNEAINLKAKGYMADKDDKKIEKVRDVKDDCTEFNTDGSEDRHDDMIILSRPTIKQASSGEFITEIH